MVKISNHGKCKVVSIENARVRPNMDHILVLSYIRHILDLRLNLTSIEKLDYMGCGNCLSVSYCCKME